ncbi:UNVERIFIED_ORG: hypothetical protein GGE53_001248 [Rhizobium etli]
MKDIDERRLPYWPAVLNMEMAALYCGISNELFSQLCPVKPISFPEPVGGQRYLRLRLDQWLLSLDPNELINAHSAGADGALESGELGSDKGKEWRTGAGGYPVVDDPQHFLKKWYDRLGFDPETMNEEDMSRRLMANTHAGMAVRKPGALRGKIKVSDDFDSLPAAGLKAIEDEK